MFRDKFAKRLKELRNEKGLSQEELAKVVEASTNAIGMYEIGKRMPREEILEKIRDFFDCSYDYLFGFSDDPNPRADKEITVLEYDPEKNPVLTPTEKQILFQKGDLAIQLGPILSRYMYPFYLLDDILIFSSGDSYKGTIIALMQGNQMYIGKVSKHTDVYEVEFLNPSFKLRRIPCIGTHIIGTMVGMVRTMEL
ncbi:MAG TPA: helix-turn-helix transcriptional regulator [Thermotogota bacterium]|nr:helix-turn-helix transcriptional regulator [Thermotogota bacterium]